MSWIAILGWGCLAVLSQVRWWRIAQAEHYLSGRVSRFAFRWWKLWFNQIILAVMLFGLVGVFGGGDQLLWGTLVGLGWLFGPLGLGYRGTTARLQWTNRLRRLVAFSLALPMTFIGVGIIRSEIVWVLVVGIFSPVWLDLSLWILSDWEKSWSLKWVKAANKKLESIDLRLVAITGSYGKTTTKNYLAHLLSDQSRVYASPASFNNLLGLARTINNNLPSDSQVFIAEMGTYGQDEITEMCFWYPPEVGVLTAIGPVHLERMRTLDRIISAKKEIFNKPSIGVVNTDTPGARLLLRQLSQDRNRPQRLVTCGLQTDNEVAISSDNDLLIQDNWVGTVPDSLTETEKSNLVTAIAVGWSMGFDPEHILDKVRDLPQVEHRRTVAKADAGYWIIDDTYNANPQGWEAALAELGSWAELGRKLVVTPGLVELGPTQDSENRRLAAWSVEQGAELIVVGWTNRRALMSGAREAGGEPLWFRHRDPAVAWIRTQLGSGDAVLYENDLPDHFP